MAKDAQEESEAKADEAKQGHQGVTVTDERA